MHAHATELNLGIAERCTGEIMSMSLVSSLPLVMISVVCGIVGQIALKAGMTQVGQIGASSLAQPTDILVRVASSPFIIGGLVLYGLGAVSWLAVLSRVPLSLAYPLLAIGYIVIPLLAWLLFRESLSPLRWAGILVIALGVILVTRS